MKTWQKRQIVKQRQRLNTDEEINRLLQLLADIQERRNQVVAGITQPERKAHVRSCF